MKVVFINPGHPTEDATGAFWSNVNRFMQAAADDLNVELVTLYAKRNHIIMKKLAEDVVSLKPDFAIIVNEKGAGLDVVRTIAEQKIRIFTLLNGFSISELEKLTPHQKSFIIGSLTPNNYLAGKGLIKDLLALHQHRYGKRERYHLLSLLGDYRSAAATDRQKGLMDFLETRDDLVLIDSTVGNWSRESAYQKVKGLLKRNRIDIIWAANDPMAIGARQAVQEAKLTYKVTIGGMNWDEVIPEFVIDVSYGGHVALGAKALVMLSDYHEKLMSDCEMTQVVDIFRPGNQNNLAEFIENTKSEHIDSFDFARFSRAHAQPMIFDILSFVTKEFTPDVIAKTPNDCTRNTALLPSVTPRIGITL